MSKSRIFISFVASALLCGAAAADGYEIEPTGKGFAPPPAYSWTGLYIGAHVGWEQKDIEGSDPIAPQLGLFEVDGWPAATSQDIDGWIGGGQFGYNHQFGRVVIGTELSGSWGDVDGNSNCFRPDRPLLNEVDGQFSERERLDCGVSQDWTVQWLSKIGVAFGNQGRMLAYVTGGVTATELSINRQFSITGTVPIGNSCDGDCTIASSTAGIRWSGDQTAVGVVLGAGFQYALTNNVSCGVEYLHA